VNNISTYLKKYFFAGLFVILPLWATYSVLVALLRVIDGILADIPAHLLGYRIPGLGIITLFLLVLITGILFANFLGRQIVRVSDELLQKVPLVRGVYFTVKQVMETFSLKHQFRGVGLIEYPRKGCYSVGFMTGETRGEGIGLSGKMVTVFVPTTPNPTAGFLLVLPEEEVVRLDMSVEEGMKFIISLGMVSSKGLQTLKPGQKPNGASA
jgi:uncharacterized membrane protein